MMTTTMMMMMMKLSARVDSTPLATPTALGGWLPNVFDAAAATAAVYSTVYSWVTRWRNG